MITEKIIELLTELGITPDAGVDGERLCVCVDEAIFRVRKAKEPDPTPAPQFWYCTFIGMVPGQKPVQGMGVFDKHPLLWADEQNSQTILAPGQGKVQILTFSEIPLDVYQKLRESELARQGKGPEKKPEPLIRP